MFDGDGNGADELFDSESEGEAYGGGSSDFGTGGGLSYRERDELRRAHRVDEFMRSLDEPSPSKNDALSEYKARMSDIVKVPAKRGPVSDNDRAGADMHRGHRSRLREAATKDKRLDTFGEVELLETLLSYFTPRRDTNATAHKILADTSLREVMTNATQSFAGADNVTQSAAQVAGALSELGYRRGMSEVAILNRQQAVEYFSMTLFGDAERGTHVAYLDDGGRLIAHETYSGDELIDLKRIAGSVYGYDAHAVIVARRARELLFRAHDYIEDVDALIRLLSVMGTVVLDCFIFDEFGFFSLGGVSPHTGERKFVFMPTAAFSSSPELCEMLARRALALSPEKQQKAAKRKTEKNDDDDDVCGLDDDADGENKDGDD